MTFYLDHIPHLQRVDVHQNIHKHSIVLSISVLVVCDRVNEAAHDDEIKTRQDCVVVKLQGIINLDINRKVHNFGFSPNFDPKILQLPFGFCSHFGQKKIFCRNGQFRQKEGPFFAK